MARNWKDFKNDEIYGIWYSFMKTEFPQWGDPLCHQRPYERSTRLTPMEIIQLVEELLNRLEIKEAKDVQ